MAHNDISQSELAVLKLPPHSVEAEQSVLGGLLLDNSAFDKLEFLRENDFYRHDHKQVYRHIVRLIDAGKPADAITVSEALENAGELQEIGGLSYLASLVQNTPTAANIRRYAEIVRERSIMRQLVEIGTKIADSAYNPQGRDAQALLDDAEKMVFEVSESTRRGRDFVGMKDVLTEVISRIQTLYSRDDSSDVTGAPTGFIDLDNMTSGLQPGDMVIVAGRPSMGKTAFSMNLVEHVALEAKKPVAVFSMEMGAAQLATRMIGSIGRLDHHVLRTGRLGDEDWDKLNYAMGRLHEAPVFIDETGGLTSREVRNRARRLDLQCKNQGYDGLGLIVIDYLQLMSGSGKMGDNRQSEISEISRAMKGLAKELQVPIVALSQLSRAVEQRPNKRPMMSDLRESGAIEQDADVIMFLYRDEYYNPDKTDNKGMAEVIIAKQRNGPTGTVYLTFLGRHSRFENSAFRPTDAPD